MHQRKDDTMIAIDVSMESGLEDRNNNVPIIHG